MTGTTTTAVYGDNTILLTQTARGCHWDVISGPCAGLASVSPSSTPWHAEEAAKEEITRQTLARIVAAGVCESCGADERTPHNVNCGMSAWQY